MIINVAVLKALSNSLNKVFVKGLEGKDPDWQRVAKKIKSNALVQTYAWLGDTPKMREWVGDRVIKDLKAHNYTISKKDFESTIEVTRDDIEYDNIAAVKIRIQQMASEARSHYDELVFPLIEANGDCYDGKKFFAIDHPVGENSVSFSNLGTAALTQESFIAAMAEMEGLVSENGRPLKISPTLLVVPPELRATAKKILKQKTLASGEDNITYDEVELLVSRDLTNDKAWYLFDTSKPIPPMILQVNKDIKFVAMDAPTDENVFMRKAFRYGTDSQDNAGYGLWQLAYKSTGVA